MAKAPYRQLDYRRMKTPNFPEYRELERYYRRHTSNHPGNQENLAIASLARQICKVIRRARVRRIRAAQSVLDCLHG